MQENEGNHLLELRSNAGTHDLAMGRDVLERLLNAGEGEEVPSSFWAHHRVLHLHTVWCLEGQQLSSCCAAGALCGAEVSGQCS